MMRTLEAAKQSATMTGHCRRGCKEFEDLLRGACYIGYCVVSSGLAVQPLPYVTAKRAQGKLHTHIRCHGTAPHHTTLPLPLQTPPTIIQRVETSYRPRPCPASALLFHHLRSHHDSAER
jgi:hypothetical protein